MGLSAALLGAAGSFPARHGANVVLGPQPLWSRGRALSIAILLCGEMPTKSPTGPTSQVRGRFRWSQVPTRLRPRRPHVPTRAGVWGQPPRRCSCGQVRRASPTILPLRTSAHAVEQSGAARTHPAAIRRIQAPHPSSELLRAAQILLTKLSSAGLRPAGPLRAAPCSRRPRAPDCPSSSRVRRRLRDFLIRQFRDRFTHITPN